MKCDYSSKLFLAPGSSTPSFLPQSFNLPCGASRFSYCVSLEELKACGYRGPFDVPEYNYDTQTVYFSLETESFIVKDKTTEDINVANSYKIKALMTEILSTRQNILKNKDLTEEARKGYLQYFGSIQYVLDTVTPLTEADIPEIPLFHPKTIQEEKAICDAYVASGIENWRVEYETDGSKSWEQLPLISGIFEIPSDWISGSL